MADDRDRPRMDANEALANIGYAVRVFGGDYEYDGRLSCIFTKRRGGGVRVVVEDDNGRLFIHKPDNLRTNK